MIWALACLIIDHSLKTALSPTSSPPDSPKHRDCRERDFAGVTNFLPPRVRVCHVLCWEGKIISMAGHRKPSAVLVPLLTLFLTNAPAQVRIGYSGRLTAEASADIDQELTLGSPDQREDLLKILGVDGAIAHNAAVAVAATDIHSEPIAGSQARLLFLPCSNSGYPSSHLYLLSAEKNQHWHATDSFAFDCWWKPTSHELIQIQGKTEQSVLVHHVNHGHGSGVVEDHLLLFDLQGDRLTKVLETEEYTSEDGMASGHIIQHSSTLLSLPDGSLEETRITTTQDPSSENGKGQGAFRMRSHITLAERRLWRWSDINKDYWAEGFAIIHP